MSSRLRKWIAWSALASLGTIAQAASGDAPRDEGRKTASSVGTLDPASSAVGGYSQAEIESIIAPEEAQIRELRLQEIQQLRLTLGRRQPENRRAELYYRLAELYQEGYHAEFLLEGRLHELKREQGKADRTILRARSRSYLLSGVKVCQELLALGIPFERSDRIYLFLGINFTELDRKAESLQAFETLIRRFPDSPYAADAYRELGDSEMEQRRYERAQAWYEKGLEKEKGELRPRLLHKLSWTCYRLRQFDRAVESLKEAVRLAESGNDKFVSLKEELLRDLAIFMTETGKVDEALLYFKKAAGDRDYYPKALERLGRQYERNADPVKATLVFETLLQTRPEDEAAYRVMVKLVDLDLRRGKLAEALKRLDLQRIHELEEGRPDTRAATRNLRAMIRKVATDRHERNRRDADSASLLVAERFYSVYLDRFLKNRVTDPETTEIRMYLAEVKRDLGKSKEASALYRQIVESRDTRYARDAGKFWLASLSEAIKKAAKETPAQKAADSPSALESEFVEAADALSASLSDSVEGRDAALRAAQVLAGYPSSRKEALGRVAKLVSAAPQSSQGQTAARLWVQILVDGLADGATLAELPEALRAIRGNQDLLAADKASGAKLEADLTQAERKMRIGAITAAEKRKDFSAAGQGYEEFALSGKVAGPAAHQAWISAIQSYSQAGDFPAVERVGAELISRGGDTRKTLASLQSAATAALIDGQFEASARLFEVCGKGGLSAESLETAGLIWAALDQKAEARRVLDVHLKLHPQHPARGSLILRLAKSLESSGRQDEAIQRYLSCANTPGVQQAECRVRAADLQWSRGSAQGALLGWKKASQGPASPFVGYARLKLLEHLEQSHSEKFKPIELPEANLKVAVQQRMKALVELTQAAEGVVESQGPWGVAAQDRLASWVLHFAEELEALSPPDGASEEGSKAFREGIASVSGPLRKKAEESWEKAYQNAVRGEWLSPIIPALGDRLAASVGKGPWKGLAQGTRGGFRLAGVSPDGGKEGNDPAMLRIRALLTKTPTDASAWVDYGNLLWGSGQPGLARLAYDRGGQLNPRSSAALNNRGVAGLGGVSEEEWWKVEESDAFFQEALSKDSAFIPALMNRALLLNYYRLFPRSLKLWESLLARSQAPEVLDGFAVALQGTSKLDAAEAQFKKATQAGAAEGRWVKVFHEAARKKKSGQCLEALSQAGGPGSGFEQQAYEALKRSCEKWKED